MIELLNCDCMEYMATQPDNAFDLAIVDPPYGIGANKMTLGNGKKKIFRGNSDWDIAPPSEKYFEELFRVSTHQVIWGANHFISKFARDSSCWVFWDKNNGDSLFADGEMAWTSFDTPVRIAKIHWCGSAAKWETGTNKIHPTQKPEKLYKWILDKYAKKGNKILDTHLGSGSSAIAAHYFGVDFVGCELDKDYFEAAKARFDMATRQLALSV